MCSSACLSCSDGFHSLLWHLETRDERMGTWRTENAVYPSLNSTKLYTLLKTYLYITQVFNQDIYVMNMQTYTHICTLTSEPVQALKQLDYPYTSLRFVLNPDSEDKIENRQSISESTPRKWKKYFNWTRTFLKVTCQEEKKLKLLHLFNTLWLTYTHIYSSF